MGRALRRCAATGQRHRGGEGEESVFADYESVPAWARSGVGAMLTLGVFDEDTAKALGEKVTRADTASYLYKLSSNK